MWQISLLYDKLTIYKQERSRNYFTTVAIFNWIALGKKLINVTGWVICNMTANTGAAMVQMEVT